MEELEIIHSRQVPGIRVLIDRVEYRTAHFHPEWELLFVLENPLQVYTRQQEFSVEPGQLVLFSPNVSHAFRALQGDCVFLCLQVGRDFLPGLEDRTADTYLPGAFLDCAAVGGTLLEIARTFFEQRPFYQLQVRALVSEVFHTLFTAIPTHCLTSEEIRSRDSRNARLVRFQQFVDENYMHKIRLADFAAREGCSLSFLSHFVKDSLNQTFQEYVDSVRFRRACQLLSDGDKKMLEVCMESGYSDYRYFSRAFRSRCGMSPEQYSRSSMAAPDARLHGSLHSVERHFTPEQSLQYISIYKKL